MEVLCCCKLEMNTAPKIVRSSRAEEEGYLLEMDAAVRGLVRTHRGAIHMGGAVLRRGGIKLHRVARAHELLLELSFLRGRDTG
jgi:hypothetical protein